MKLDQHTVEKMLYLILMLVFGWAAAASVYIVYNQQRTDVARQSNIARQNEMKAYIKCIVLIGKTNPNINFQAATKEQVETILDKCAADTSASE